MCECVTIMCTKAWGCNATSFDTLNAKMLHNLPPEGQKKYDEDSDRWLGAAARQFVRVRVRVSIRVGVHIRVRVRRVRISCGANLCLDYNKNLMPMANIFLSPD